MLALINNLAGTSRVSSCAIAPIPGRSFERWVVARVLQQIETPLSLSLPRLARELSFNRGAFAGPWSHFSIIDVLLEPEPKPADPWAAPTGPRPSPSWVELQIPSTCQLQSDSWRLCHVTLRITSMDLAVSPEPLLLFFASPSSRGRPLLRQRLAQGEAKGSCRRCLSGDGVGGSRRPPPFLGRDRAAVSVHVNPERRSPRYHETSPALEIVQERCAAACEPCSVWLRSLVDRSSVSVNATRCADDVISARD